MRRPDLAILIFLFGIPLAIGVMLGANQLRAGAYLPWGLSVAYWTMLSLVTWLVFAAATWLVARLLRPWRPPAPANWLVGAVLGSLAARPLIYLLAGLFRPAMRDGPFREMPPVTASLDFLFYYVTNWSAIILLWMLANWALVFWLAVRQRRADALGRDQAQPVPARLSTVLTAAEQAAASSFLDRLPARIGTAVIALQSEDHYVRVHARNGDALILGTISDAINAVEGQGVAGQRVHRSWWIATAAVADCRADGRRLTAVLDNGLEVPISQTYRELARLAGIISTGKASEPPRQPLHSVG